MKIAKIKASIILLSAINVSAAYADGSDRSLSVLDRFKDGSEIIRMTSPILIPANEREVALGSSDSWDCRMQMKTADREERRIVPREIRVEFFSRKAIDEEKLRHFHWYWNGRSSGPTYTETHYELMFTVEDKTIRRIKCISKVDVTTLKDLETVMQPLDLGLPQETPSSGSSAEEPRKSEPKDA